MYGAATSEHPEEASARDPGSIVVRAPAGGWSCRRGALTPDYATTSRSASSPSTAWGITSCG
jgi:hypothetical protein